MRNQNLHLSEAFSLLKQTGLWRVRSFVLLAVYYLATVFSALLDGVSVVLLVNLITGNSSLSDPDPILRLTVRFLTHMGWPSDLKALLFAVIAVFLVRVLLYWAVWAMDGIFPAVIRRKIQEGGFARTMLGDWEALREIRVGQRAGAMTEEAVAVTKYLSSGIRLLYYLIASTILISIAFFIQPQLTLVMACVGIPTLFLLQLLFAKQARLSAAQMASRQSFAAAITERLAGLFQIKAEGRPERHIERGLECQPRLTQIEISLGYTHAFAASLELLLPVVALLAYFFWTVLAGQAIQDSLHILAGVGVVGVRAAAQINGLIGSWGNLARLSGSIPPVHELFRIPTERQRSPLMEKLIRVELEDVSYLYNGGFGIRGITLSVERGIPFVLKGPSGSGKTTLANVTVGLYRPHHGKVLYIGESGQIYDADRFKARVGYVTQDIYLFHGTVRQNLSDGHPVGSPTLWSCLDRVGAADVVRSLGGLEATIVESGKSLSGGERRRLGIARALVENPDFIIFDEVTAGLDEYNRSIVREAVLHAAENALVIIITHEDIFDDLGRTFLMQLCDTA